MRIPFAVLGFAFVLAFVGCNDSTAPKVTAPPLTANDTPAHAVTRLVTAYEKKSEDAFAGMFTGDYQFEFSTSTDPTLVQQYSTGWFKLDETESSSHLFTGYTPPGGTTLPAATTITITYANTTPTDDSSAVDPKTHKVLASRVDGSITVPQSGSEPLTYVISNNYHVIYLVRGDVAAGLTTSQPADSLHWYVYRWVDQSQAYGVRTNTQPSTWARVKGIYR